MQRIYICWLGVPNNTITQLYLPRCQRDLLFVVNDIQLLNIHDEQHARQADLSITAKSRRDVIRCVITWPDAAGGVILLPISTAHISVCLSVREQKQVVTLTVATGRIVATAHIDPSYSPGDANVHPVYTITHGYDGCTVPQQN